MILKIEFDKDELRRIRRSVTQAKRRQKKLYELSFFSEDRKPIKRELNDIGVLITEWDDLSGKKRPNFRDFIGRR